MAKELEAQPETEDGEKITTAVPVAGVATDEGPAVPDQEPELGRTPETGPERESDEPEGGLKASLAVLPTHLVGSVPEGTVTVITQEAGAVVFTVKAVTVNDLLRRT